MFHAYTEIQELKSATVRHSEGFLMGVCKINPMPGDAAQWSNGHKSVKVILRIPFDTGDRMTFENESLEKMLVEGGVQGKFRDVEAIAVDP